MTGTHLIRPIVEDAVRRFACPTSPLFSIGTFTAAVLDAFALRDLPTEGWCHDVLAKLGYVSRTSVPTLYVSKP